MSKSKHNKIYFVQAPNGLFKIGKSKNPKARLKTLQVGSPVLLKIKKVVQGGLYLESILHIYFKHLRKHGEWFKPDYELKQFLNNERNITISGILDVVEKEVTKKMIKYLKMLEEKRMYL